jgi:RNA polymerase sigma factor (sigma-70 family)
MDDDAELLTRWQRGDAEAGEALIERHTPRLYRFFAAAVTDGAEDLCQQTFAACFEAKAGIVEDAAGGKSFRSFLFTVARRRLINHYRGRGRNEAKLDPLEQSVAELTQGPVTLIGEQDEQRLVADALVRLPIDYQIALQLHYWEDMSASEIGEVLGVPLGTIKSRLLRGRERLKELIAEAALAGGGEDGLERTDELARNLGRR